MATTKILIASAATVLLLSTSAFAQTNGVSTAVSPAGTASGATTVAPTGDGPKADRHWYDQRNPYRKRDYSAALHRLADGLGGAKTGGGGG